VKEGRAKDKIEDFIKIKRGKYLTEKIKKGGGDKEKEKAKDRNNYIFSSNFFDSNAMKFLN
jgi:hypothetical protein